MNKITSPVRRACAAGLALALLAPAGPAHGHEMAKPKTELFKPGAGFAAGDTAGGDGGRPPLHDGLGELTMQVTTGSAQAQAYFDQGLAFAWGFNHAEARRSFAEAGRLDPDCAMCFWGEAFVLGPNINDGMPADAVRPAYEAVRRALALKDRVTPREQALIEALASRYAPSSMAARPPLDQAWADAMRGVAAAYPGDADVQVLFAEALMNLQPWDYWEAGGVTPKGHGGEIVAVLERALAIDPEHPAAAHLYIHAVEASANPGRAEAAADRLRGAMPGAGHLVHMPAHIYTRVGRYGDAMAVNRDAIAADEAFLARVGAAASPLYRFGYYPHNVHYLMVSAQMAGVREDVIASAGKLAAVISDEVAQELAWVQAIKTAPYTAHSQFSGADDVMALPDPGAAFPFVRGIRHYARGTALARAGDPQAAAAEAVAIGRLIATADLAGLEAQYLPAREVLRIARLVVEARIAQAEGNQATAERHLRAAIALQDDLPYMEPPYWYYPVRQTLGAVLLQQGRAEDAVAAFRAALEQAPRNGWALWGLMQAQQAAGLDSAEAAAAFEAAWLGDRSLLKLDRF